MLLIVDRLQRLQICSSAAETKSGASLHSCAAAHLVAVAKQHMHLPLNQHLIKEFLCAAGMMAIPQGMALLSGLATVKQQ